MRVYKVEEDGCVYHWVLAINEDAAIRLTEKHLIESYGNDNEYEALEVQEVPDEETLTINLEGIKIKHTPQEWAAIYGYKERYLACSEY